MRHWTRMLRKAFFTATCSKIANGPVMLRTQKSQATLLQEKCQKIHHSSIGLLDKWKSGFVSLEERKVHPSYYPSPILTQNGLHNRWIVAPWCQVAMVQPVQHSTSALRSLTPALSQIWGEPLQKWPQNAKSSKWKATRPPFRRPPRSPPCVRRRSNRPAPHGS